MNDTYLQAQQQYHQQEQINQQRKSKEYQQQHPVTASQKQIKQCQFGTLLHECLGVSPKDCPNIDDSSVDTNNNTTNNINNKNDTTKNDHTFTNKNNTNKEAFKCNGKAKVKIYALEPPLALAISVGEN